MSWFSLVIFLLLTPVQSDLELLSSIITAECSICSEQEKYLVGSSVLNRRDLEDFPNTIDGVLTQDSQYVGRYSKWFVETEESTRIAKNLLLGFGRDKEIVYFYSSDAPDQKFVKAMKPYIKYELEYHTYSKHYKK